jgi:hypothetical protein
MVFNADLKKGYVRKTELFQDNLTTELVLDCSDFTDGSDSRTGLIVSEEITEILL